MADQPVRDADPVRHLQVETPNWDTKIRCLCGADFTSRAEFYKHGYEAYLALLNDGTVPHE